MKNGSGIVCIHCSQDVKGPVRSATGVLTHTGHVDQALDTTCGTWGFTQKKPEREG